jgi:hypothetical protein
MLSSKPSSPPIFLEGDPCLSFHEFQLILCRIAIDTFPKELLNPNLPVEQPLLKLLEEGVELKRKEGDPRREEKVFGKRMKDSYEEGKKGVKVIG